MKLLLIAIVSNSYGFLNNEDILRLSYTYLGRVLRHNDRFALQYFTTKTASCLRNITIEAKIGKDDYLLLEH